MEFSQLFSVFVSWKCEDNIPTSDINGEATSISELIKTGLKATGVSGGLIFLNREKVSNKTLSIGKSE